MLGYFFDITYQEQPMPSQHQQCQPETQSNFFSHNIATWISAVHLKLKFKINGVDESKTEHGMTDYSGIITHSKSMVIIQDEKPI